MRTRLVLPVDGHIYNTTPHPPQEHASRSLWSHKSPCFNRDAFSECIISPSCHCVLAWCIQGNKRLGQPPINNPAVNPHSNCSQRTNHSVSTSNLFSLFLKHAQHGSTSSRLRADIIGKQHLPLNCLLTRPSTRPHPQNS